MQKKSEGKRREGKRRRSDREPVEFICPRCKRTEIFYLPTDQELKCPDCKRNMVIKEVLAEGKSY